MKVTLSNPEHEIGLLLFGGGYALIAADLLTMIGAICWLGMDNSCSLVLQFLPAVQAGVVTIFGACFPSRWSNLSRGQALARTGWLTIFVGALTATAYTGLPAIDSGFFSTPLFGGILPNFKVILQVGIGVVVLGVIFLSREEENESCPEWSCS